MSSSLFATAKIYTNVACVLGPEGPGEHQQQPWGRRDDTQAAAAHEKPIKPNPHHIDSPHFIFSLSPSLPNSTANENEGWQKRRTTTRNNNKNTAAYQSRQHQLSSSSWNHLYYFNPHSIPSTLDSHSLCDVADPIPRKKFSASPAAPPSHRKFSSRMCCSHLSLYGVDTLNGRYLIHYYMLFNSNHETIFFSLLSLSPSLLCFSSSSHKIIPSSAFSRALASFHRLPPPLPPLTQLNSRHIKKHISFHSSRASLSYGKFVKASHIARAKWGRGASRERQQKTSEVG